MPEIQEELECLRALNMLLATALEDMCCTNCDDRKCMSCVLRIDHETCEDDCVNCAPHPARHNPLTRAFIQREAALKAWRDYRG